jgi:hypothetical protein
MDSSKNTERPRYLAYLLRLWQAGSDEELTWRASLESPRTGKRHSFASLDLLFVFLTQCTLGSECRVQPQDSSENVLKAQKHT